MLSSLVSAEQFDKEPVSTLTVAHTYFLVTVQTIRVNRSVGLLSGVNTHFLETALCTAYNACRGEKISTFCCNTM